MQRRSSAAIAAVRRRARRNLLLFATLFPAFATFLLPAAAARADDVRHAEVQTEHYSVYVEKLDADEFGRLLEAFHAHMTAAFGVAPEGELRFELYASAARFKDALARDGEDRVEAGGYFSHKTRKAYLFIQPSAYFTRQLALHECAHQFHLLARAGNRSPRANWYVEGLAEFYGTHNWDGKTLEFCSLPVMTLEDYPAKALDEFTGKLARNLGSIVAGKGKVGRPVAWALVFFLNKTEPEKFKTLCAKLDAMAEPRVAWRQTFGDVTPAMTEAFEAWLRSNQQAWDVAFVEWQQRGDAFEGFSDTTATALLKQTPTLFTASVASAKPGTMPGLVFDYRSKDDHRVLQIMPNKKIRLGHRKDGKWQAGKLFDLPARPDGEPHDVLAIVPGTAGGTVVLRVNGTELTTLPAQGRVGLYVQEGKATFRVKID